MIAVDLSGSNAEPCYDPVSHLVHAVGREAVTDVWVGGRRIVENRVLQSADEPRSPRLPACGRSDSNECDENAAPPPRPVATIDIPSDRTGNVDAGELDKFAALAHQWWDPESAMFGPLHKMNPLRLDWIEQTGDLSRASASSTWGAAAAS
jgi:hypothetical protein